MSMHIRALLTAATLLSHASAANLNLFDAFNSTKKKPPCQEEILQRLEALNGTGAQAFNVEEDQLQLCPNLCEKEFTLDFCSANEPHFVKAFAAKVRSDRCCNEKSCHCICHFDCLTFEKKEAEFKQQGFRKCTAKDTTKAGILEEGAKACKSEAKKADCESSKPHFVCPRQFACVGRRCVICINAECVSSKDKVITDLMILSQNKTVSDKMQTMRNMFDQKKEKGGKAYRSLDAPENKVDVGFLN